jgi:transcriptional regulator with XRE-family HTH domain
MANLNRIKVVLVEQDKTGKWLAEKLGKSTCTISKWCTNTAQPDLQTLADIAKVLGVDKRDLLTPSE